MTTAGRWVRRALTLAVAVAAIASLPLHSASAADPAILESSLPQAVRTAEGGATARVAVHNLTSRSMTMSPAVSGDPGCDVSAQPSRLAANRRSEVVLALSAGCAIEGGITVTMTLAAPGMKAAPTLIQVQPPQPPAAPTPTAPPKVQLIELTWAAAAGGLAALITLAGLFLMKGVLNRSAETPNVGLGTSLTEIDTDWSFRDGWVSNLTVATTALVALLAASDVLPVFLGDKAVPALAHVAIASGIAGLAVGMSVLLLKIVGGDPDVATVGGIYLAGALVVFGAVTQIAAITWQITDLTKSRNVAVLTWLVGVVVALIMIAYAVVTLHGHIKRGLVTRQVVARTPEEAPWLIIADAIDPLARSLIRPRSAFL